MASRWGALAWRTLKESAHDELALIAAALAFFALLATVPAFALVVLAATLLFGGGEWVRQSFFGGAQQLFGDTRADALETIIEGATPHGSDWWTLAVASVILLSALWQLMAAIEVALNRIWDVKPDPRRSFAKLLRKRFLSFGLILALAFLILCSLALSSLVAAVMPREMVAGQLASIGLTFLGAWAMLTLVFHRIPAARVAWRHAFAGAAVTALFLSAGERLLALFIVGESFASVYGGLAGIVLALLWAYYSSLIFLVGAELTQVIGAAAGEAEPEREIARRRGEKRTGAG